MELSGHIFTDVLSPLAAFTDRPPSIGKGPGQSQEGVPAVDDDPPWEASFLNPQSRINSLTPRYQPKWRVDGVDVDGRRFFATPTFGIGKPPLRIDVYLPPPEDCPGHLKDVLKPDALLYMSRSGVSALPITQHLLRALENWSSRLVGFESQYLNMPYGSQILVTSITTNLDEMSSEIHLCPSYDVEQAMLSVESLQSMWGLPESAWPPLLEWDELQFQRQLHESITLVTVSGRTQIGKSFVFKSLTRDQRYMYNELKMLLTLPPHPNIISRPAYVVTKRGRFGGKKGVCGFLIEYFLFGSLKQHLYDVGAGALPQVTLKQRFEWSTEITSALIHVNSHPAGFYPDLKPDNVVLRPSGSSPGQLDAVLLDLEQRGGWYSWSPPEVAYTEYLEVVFIGLEDEHTEVCDEIQELLEASVPQWAPGSQHDRYHNSDGGFSAPWLALLRRKNQSGSLDLERAQAFMLGKLLWCIFEGTPWVRCGIDHELLQDNGGPNNEMRLQFPEFRKTPQELRRLIQRCTEGAPEWEKGRTTCVLELQSGRLVARDQRNAQDVAREYWVAEVERAKDFLGGLKPDTRAQLGEGLAGRALRESITRRPTLAEIRQELERMARELGG